MSENKEELTGLAADIVSAFVSHNSVPTAELPALIASTHAALVGLGQPPAPAVEEKSVPAVAIRKSITPDAITCLECGLSFRTLKRHLRTSHELTSEQYRNKWSLPADYPVTAPAYTEARSALAKSIGLGRKAVAPPAPVSAKRGRAKTSA